jgi:DUF4097 and DUF4098 domain-containing protein YvlB
MPNGAYIPRRRSITGPFMLIVIGVVFLLWNLGYRFPVLQAYARYWPVLLIIWGVVRLWEHSQAKRHGYAAGGIGFWGVLVLVFIIIFGLGARTANRVNWHALQGEIDVDDDFANFFGKSTTFDDQMEQEFPAGAMLRITSDRGAVSVDSWDQDRIKIVYHKKIVASSDSETEKLNTESRPEITVTGNVVTLNANTTGGGNHQMIQTDMQLTVPRKAALEISNRRGDVSARNRQGDVKLSTSRGDIAVEDIKGNVEAQLRRGSFRAGRIDGTVAVQGRVNDASISEVTGNVTLNGDFLGSLALSKIAKPVSFRSARTELEMTKLDGDLNMESGDLRISSAAGPVRIVTRSKDIHLERVTGDVRLENSNGTIEVHADKPPLGLIEISNKRGDIQVVLPAKSAFDLDARTRRGDIQSDFNGISVQNEHHESRATGQVGSGGARVQINSEYGDVSIRRAG